jgi:hypothetical protein
MDLNKEHDENDPMSYAVIRIDFGNPDGGDWENGIPKFSGIQVDMHRTNDMVVVDAMLNLALQLLQNRLDKDMLAEAPEMIRHLALEHGLAQTMLKARIDALNVHNGAVTQAVPDDVSSLLNE